MASAVVMGAVEGKLTTDWRALCSGVGLAIPPAIVTPNQPSNVPTDLSPFLVVEFPVANEVMMSVGAPGANLFREDGGFLFTLCVRIGTSIRATETPYAQLMDALRADFRLKTIPIGSTYLTTFEASPTTFRGSSDRRAYCELSSSISYWFDLFA